MVFSGCGRLDSVTIPGYFALPEFFALASEQDVTQWRPAALRNLMSSPIAIQPG
jgi:hypothetical protein